jgi:hypothetical protein
LAANVVFPRTGCGGWADGLATAGVLIPPDRFLPLVKKLGGEALVLIREGDRIREHKTGGWDQLVSKD